MTSPIVPRPRPGYTSPSTRPDHTAIVAFIGATLRTALGVVFAFMATLWLPIHMATPILTGLGILMVVNGCLAAWRLGREIPAFRGPSRILVWSAPTLLVVILLLLAILGPSGLGPDWSAVRNTDAAGEGR